MPFPLELRVAPNHPRAVMNFEEPFSAPKAILASVGLEGEMPLSEEIEEIAVPVVHFNDASAVGKGLGEAEHRAHHAAPPMSLSSRTRL